MSRIEEAMQKKARGEAPRRTRAAAAPATDGAATTVQTLARPATAANVDARIISYHAPRSGLTENFKQIRIVVQNMLPEGDNKVLMFTSAYGSEGKTTACLNFAAAVAQDTSRRAIVVDADMRDPKVHTLMGMKPLRGFGDLLTSDAPIDSVVVSTPVPGLSAILCGEIPTNPAELFGSDRSRQIFAELKMKYDCVIVDTPPVLPVADTIHIGAFADGVVLIVEAARTGRKKVQHAIQLLNNANASVMGFLLNKGQVASSDYYASRYYRG